MDGFFDSKDSVSGKSYRISRNKKAQTLAKQVGAIRAYQHNALSSGKYVKSVRFTGVANAGTSALVTHAGGVGPAHRMVDAARTAGMGKYRRHPAGSSRGGQFKGK